VRVLITGATDGLGLRLAIELARRGHTILAHGRSPERLDKALEEIRAANPGAGPEAAPRGYLADFASLAAVRSMAAEVLERERHLDVLVNNAGIGGGPGRQESQDGYELRFQVNYLAHFALTRLLLPLLRASAPARIVHVSSAGQSPIDFTDVMLTRSYRSGQAYTQSKLAQIMFTIDLAAELAGTGVTTDALHPSTYMPTKMVANPISTLEDGVRATAALVDGEFGPKDTGRYFNVTRQDVPYPQASDPEARRALRELSERLTGVR
jgi:NAD(P)-dependent dehydrogenase (short-subunit alcohol dehydrogenase family)